MKSKGFTLIELLAVIIILGILMLIAIPSVTNYINNSKKSTYVTTINQLVKGVEMKVSSSKIKLTDKDTTYYIPYTCVETENGDVKSPYGKFDPAYVAVTFDGIKLNYYFAGRDITNMGVSKLTDIDKISNNSIVTNVNTIDTSVGIKGTSYVSIFNDDCSEIIEKKPVSSIIVDDEIVEVTDTDNEEITSDPTTCKKQTCPASYTPIIYWALQDTDNDGKNDKLIISDSEVDGNYKGSFEGNKIFYWRDSVPWIATQNEYSDENLSGFVSSIVVEGVVAPISTAHWFYTVGYRANNMNADLKNLFVCHVTDMQYMFSYLSPVAHDFNIDGLCGWDTSKVTNMYEMFHYSGNRSYYWSVGSLGNWDVSKVTNMFEMFSQTGTNAINYSLGNLDNWDTSSVTDMSEMFKFAGQKSNSWSIGNISKWNTSKVTNMRLMFYFVARDSATSFSLNLSGWNTSNVTDMTNMFGYTGYSATDFKIIIPMLNPDGTFNTTTEFFGKDGCSTPPPTDREFSLFE